MLSTTQTLICPSCGQPAIIRVLTVRHRRGVRNDGFEPLLTFCCPRGCRLAVETIRELCGMDLTA